MTEHKISNWISRKCCDFVWNLSSIDGSVFCLAKSLHGTEITWFAATQYRSRHTWMSHANVLRFGRMKRMFWKFFCSWFVSARVTAKEKEQEEIEMKKETRERLRFVFATERDCVTTAFSRSLTHYRAHQKSHGKYVMVSTVCRLVWSVFAAFFCARTQLARRTTLRFSYKSHYHRPLRMWPLVVFLCSTSALNSSEMALFDPLGPKMLNWKLRRRRCLFRTHRLGLSTQSFIDFRHGHWHNRMCWIRFGAADD